MRAVLSLQVPTAGQMLTVVMDSNHKLLLEFKRSVLIKYEWAVIRAETDIERDVRQKKLEHMRELLDFLIPDNGNDSDCDEKES